jgi:hypothetical protein
MPLWSFIIKFLARADDTISKSAIAINIARNSSTTRRCSRPGLLRCLLVMQRFLSADRAAELICEAAGLSVEAVLREYRCSEVLSAPSMK